MLITRSTALLPEPTGAFWIADHRAFPGQGPIRLSLIIPTYNERQNLSLLIPRLCALLETSLSLALQYEIIIVDDNSPDQTWQLALDLSQRYPAVRVMRRQRERGLSTAVLRGWQVARGDRLGVMDGDLQHPPETLQSLLLALEEGADVAIASRHLNGGGMRNWSWDRRVLSRGAQMLGLLIAPQIVGRVSDPMSGYFLVRRQAIAERLLNPSGYKILLEVLGRGGILRIAEVPYVFQTRQWGESKVTGQAYWDYLGHLWQLNRYRRYLDRLERQSRNLPTTVGRFMRFALVGLSGVGVDMVILYLLSDPSSLGWWLLPSKAIAAEIAMVNNFVWNDCWTFQDLARDQRRGKQRLKRFVKFNLICLVGLGLNLLILQGLSQGLGVNRYLANLGAIALVTAWNFWINFKLGWRVTERSQP